MKSSQHLTCLAVLTFLGTSSAVNGCGGDEPRAPGAAAGAANTAGGDNQGDADAGNGPDDAARPCSSDKQCTSFDKLCDTSLNVCVECITKDDCAGDDSECSGGICIERVACTSSLACPEDQVCFKEEGYCVDCNIDADCGSDEICADHACALECSSDKDCRTQGLLCDVTAGHCVDCTETSDCAEDHYCASNQCLPDVCTAGAASCSSGSVFECVADGSRFEQMRACGGACVDDDDGAHCDDEN